MMDAAALGTILRAAEHDLFRLEALDYYEPDEANFRRWAAGEPLEMEAWLDRLRAEKERGLRRRRVHVLRSPAGPYLRFECAVYERNAGAGEDIRILDRAETMVPRQVEPADFWVADGRDVVVMHYDDGRFAGASLAEPGLCGYFLAARDAAWDAAEPFGTWWARHRNDRKAA